MQERVLASELSTTSPSSSTPHRTEPPTVLEPAARALRIVGVSLDSDGTAHDSELEHETSGRRITAISAGQNSTLAVTNDGAILSASMDGYGQCNSDLVSAAKNKRVAVVAAGDAQSLALTDDGRIIAAGDDSSELVSQVGNRRVTAIAVAWYSMLALTADGEVVGAGSGTHDQALNLPARTKGHRITAISAGWHHCLALTTDGQVIGSGDDEHQKFSSLVSQTEHEPVTAISAGLAHSLALTADGRIIAAGHEDAGEITELIRQTSGKHIAAIAAGKRYSLALTTDGEVIAIGKDRFGLIRKLKDKTRGRKSTDIAAGDTRALALVEQPSRSMAAQASIASLPTATDSEELGVSDIRVSAHPRSQHSTVSEDSLDNGENQSIQISTGESSVASSLNRDVRTVHGAVTVATGAAGTHAPLVTALTALRLDVTVTSTYEDTPSATVHLTFGALAINGQAQPVNPAPDTTISLENGGKVILNRQQPDDSGIDVTAVALFDNNDHEVMRIGHVSAHLPTRSAHHQVPKNT